MAVKLFGDVIVGGMVKLFGGVVVKLLGSMTDRTNSQNIQLPAAE